MEEELKSLNESLEERVVERTEDLRIETSSHKLSEEKYHNLFNNAYDAIFVADLETGIILEANKSAEKLIGMPAEEIVGMHQAQLHPREDLEHYECMFENHVQNGTAQDEAIVIHKESHKIPVSITASVVEYGGKRVIQGVFRDMRESKKAERDIKQLNELLEQCHVWLDNSPVCTKVVDLDFNLLFMSAAGIKALKIDNVTTLYGKPYPFDFFPESTRRGMVKNLKKVKETGEVITGEAPVCDIEGNELWFQATLVPVRDDEGRIDFIIVVSVDINERKQAEEKMEKLNETLEERVIERTEELKNKNIELANEITERKHGEEQIKSSLKEKETLLMEIHHRVRNNLQVISSLLLLHDKYLKDEQSIKVFKDAQNRIHSMADVHEILYAAKHLSDIDFSQYVRSLADRLFSSYGISPDKISLKISISDVMLAVDQAVPLGLLVNELLSNSIEHAFPFDKIGVESLNSDQCKPEGKQEGYEICVSLTPTQDNRINFIVSDNGVGIPEDLDFRTTDSIGLNLVTVLAEDQLKGEIALNRSVKGAKFQIIF